MSYDEHDAAYDRFVDDLYKDFRESALDDVELYDRIVLHHARRLNPTDFES